MFFAECLCWRSSDTSSNQKSNKEHCQNFNFENYWLPLCRFRVSLMQLWYFFETITLLSFYMRKLKQCELSCMMSYWEVKRNLFRLIHFSSTQLVHSSSNNNRISEHLDLVCATEKPVEVFGHYRKLKLILELRGGGVLSEQVTPIRICSEGANAGTWSLPALKTEWKQTTLTSVLEVTTLGAAPLSHFGFAFCTWSGNSLLDTSGLERKGVILSRFSVKHREMFSQGEESIAAFSTGHSLNLFWNGSAESKINMP